MAIVCRQCGRHNVDGAQFCANPDCGAYLPWGGGNAGPAPQPVPVVGGAPVRQAPEAQNAAASLTLAQPALSVVPGETATAAITIHNGGTQVEQFAVRVIGPAAPWANVEPSTVTVYPSSRADCTIRFSPPRQPGTVPGRAWFTIRATSVLHPGLTVGGNGTLEVGAFRNVAATLTPQGTSGRWRTVHSIDVTNTGNVIEPVAVRADDQAGKLRFALPAGEVSIPPGTHQINVPVRPTLRLFGKPQPFPFQVTVTPRQPVPPIALTGNREAIPLIAGWVAKVAVVVALVGAAGGAVAVAGKRLPMFTAGASTPAASAPASAGGNAPSAAAPVAVPPSMPAPSSAMPSPSASPSPSPLSPVKFEAENLAEVTGMGSLTIQANTGGLMWSNDHQLLFDPPAADNAFTLKFQVKVKATYDIVLVQTQGPTYGQVVVQVDKQQIGDQFDGYAAVAAIHAPQSYGQLKLARGTHTLTLAVLGRNPSATAFQAGLDLLELDPVSSN
jgi:hypothetical protein